MNTTAIHSNEKCEHHAIILVAQAPVGTLPHRNHGLPAELHLARTGSSFCKTLLFLGAGIALVFLLGCASTEDPRTSRSIGRSTLRSAGDEGPAFLPQVAWSNDVYANARYKWIISTKLPKNSTPGHDFSVETLKLANGKMGEHFGIRGGIPMVSGELVPDAPGTSNVFININKGTGWTEYAGLKFLEPCTLGILMDGTVYVEKEGQLAQDAHGHSWQSKSVELDGKSLNAFFSRSAGFQVPETDSEKSSKENREAFNFEKSVPADWPNYSGELIGRMEVRIRNPNDFSARVGLRNGGKGKDFIVKPNAVKSVRVPSGEYEIYLQYSTEPEVLYQGDSFQLWNNGIEIRLVRVVNGNYGIRRVK